MVQHFAWDDFRLPPVKSYVWHVCVLASVCVLLTAPMLNSDWRSAVGSIITGRSLRPELRWDS